MKLIMYLAFIESTYQYLLISQFYICKFDLNYLFSITVWRSGSLYDVAWATYLLLYSDLYLATLCIEMSVLINIFLCVDLILMVRYPFDNKQNRIWKYMVASFLMAQPTSGAYELADAGWLWHLGVTVSFLYKMTFVGIFIFSVSYTYKKLNGPGFSKEVRHLVLKRHIYTCLLYLITNAYMIVNYGYKTFLSYDDYIARIPMDGWLMSTLKILFAS